MGGFQPPLMTPERMRLSYGIKMDKTTWCIKTQGETLLFTPKQLVVPDVHPISIYQNIILLINVDYMMPPIHIPIKYHSYVLNDFGHFWSIISQLNSHLFKEFPDVCHRTIPVQTYLGRVNAASWTVVSTLKNFSSWNLKISLDHLQLPDVDAEMDSMEYSQYS